MCPIDFRARCVGRLEELGDATMDPKNPNKAIGYYSNALSLGPMNHSEILAKRSKARAVTGSWEEALVDADKVWNAFAPHENTLSDPCSLDYRTRPIMLSWLRDEACGITQGRTLCRGR